MSFFSSLFCYLPYRLPTISFGITVCNEQEELELLLKNLLTHKRKKDDILVLQDITVAHQGVSDVISLYANQIVHLQAKLDGDFSTFKNNLISHAKGDYLFQIDADELPTGTLMNNIHRYLKRNKQDDCFYVPRLNTVEGISAMQLQKWNWSQNEDGYINYPDYQMRLFKLKDTKIRWVNKVHEVLTGFRQERELPSEDYSFCLMHNKQILKQEQQNRFYAKNF